MITLQERVHGIKPPENWSLGKLHHVLRIRRSNKNEGMREKRLLSLSFGRIIDKDIDAVGGLLPESFETYQIVEPGDIVMRLTDLQNDQRSIRQGLVTKRGIITSAYDALYVAPGHDPRFWAYALLALDLGKYYYSLGAGVRQSIKFDHFPNDWIAIPDGATQSAIADFLDAETSRIDRLVAKKEAMASRISERTFATISHVVTTGLDPSVPMKPMESAFLPRIPSHWTMPRLKQVAEIRGGLALGRSLPVDAPVLELPYLRVANVQTGWVDLTTVLTTRVTMAESKHFRLRAGDVLMNEGGDNDKLGRGVVWQGQVDPCLHQNHVFAVRPHELSLGYWLAFASSSKYGRDYFFLNAKQSTNLASISKSKTERFPIPLPPEQERKKIVAYLDTMIAGSQSLEGRVRQSTSLLKENRSSLITAAVTGQIAEGLLQRPHGAVDRKEMAA